MEKWHDPQTITFWLIIVLGVLLVLVFTIIRVAWLGFKRVIEAEREEAAMKLEHQRKLLETSVLIQEKERTRIAADLHDSLVGKLIGLQIKHQMQHDPHDIDKLLMDSIDEARRISHDLSPPMIDYKTLAELISGCAQSWEKSMDVRFASDVRTENELPAIVKVQFVRIVQEMLTNAWKYAHGSTVFIRLRHTPKGILLKIHDNGPGFDMEGRDGGLGMYNIELRMQQLGGKYRMRAAENRGVSAIFAVNT
jgi:two-component system, NarL family, sensor kinase